MLANLELLLSWRDSLYWARASSLSMLHAQLHHSR